jgi:MFS family permease
MRSDFLKLWIGQTISEFGSRITREGLPLIAVITLAAAPGELGLLAALEAVPVLLFALPVGVWVDRLPRRPLMIGADLARAALLLAIPLAALTGHLSMPLLLLIAPLLSLLTLVFSVAYRAILPAIVQRRDLIEANSKLATSSSLAEVAGPAIAGLLIQWITAPLAMLVDAASFLFSAAKIAPKQPLPRTPCAKPAKVWH